MAFAIIIVAVPWQSFFESVYGYPFIDREVYVNYFLYRTSVLDYVEFDSLISYVSGEFLWHFFVGLLINDLSVPIDLVFGSISIFVLIVFAKIVVCNAGARWVPLLLNPLIIDFAFSQLRLALAIAMLAAAYLSKGRPRALLVVLCAAAPLIHTASLLFIAIYVAVLGIRLIVKRYRGGQVLEFLALLALGAFISLLVGPLREVVLSAVGDRRASYVDMSSSFAYSAFWVLLLVPFSLGYRHLLKADFARYTVVILALVAVNLIHGGYSTRFLAATFPFIIASVANIRGVIAFPVFLVFLAYAVFQWLYWFRLLGA